MNHRLPSPFIRGLAVVIVGGLCAAFVMAQPPGPGRKGKGPKGPPPSAELLTRTGTVKELTTAPKGEVDGLILRDGTWVHWPPHLEDRFSDLASKGDRIKATGYMETGPKGDTKLEVSTLTNLRTKKSADNPDSARLIPGKAGNVEDRLQALEDQLDQLRLELQRLKGKK
jgi:hypothetical protein